MPACTALMQVVHFDTPLQRDIASWVRGTNTFLPSDIAVQWAREVPDEFHCRGSAIARRYAYVVLESPVRPSVEAGRVGWVYRPLDGAAMRQAITTWSASTISALSGPRSARPNPPSKPSAGSRFRSARPRSRYWRFEFEANAFLHHMIRNIMGCLVAIGQGNYPPDWLAEVMAARSRDAAAPTFSPDGLYFLGPVYEDHYGLPSRAPAYDWPMKNMISVSP
jgi:tRNA pseudouridine38-40 synthase